MPKVLVLFQSHSPDVVRLAEVVADGARSVRFSEVDLRRLPATDGAREPAPEATGRAHPPLRDADDIGQYDALILVADGEGETLVRTLGAFAGSLANKVGAVITPATGTDRRTMLWAVLGAMADRGMILVPGPFDTEGATSDESTRKVGKRVADVIGWVTHARSHHHH